MSQQQAKAPFDAHCDRDGDRDAKAISVLGAVAVGGNALSELSVRAVAMLVACCWSGLELAGGCWVAGVRCGAAAAAH